MNIMESIHSFSLKASMRQKSAEKRTIFNAAIFDMDGTLIDSMSIWENLGADFLRRRGKTPEEGLWRKVKAMSLLDGSDYFREQYGITESSEAIVTEICGCAAEKYRNDIPLKPGVLDYLKFLRVRGVPAIVATATEHELAYAALSRLGVTHYLEGIITCGEVGCGKEKPKIYLEAAQRLNVAPSRAMVYEDSLFAVETAKSAGFLTTAVYDRYEEEPKQLERTADRYVRILTDTDEYILYEKGLITV